MRLVEWAIAVAVTAVFLCAALTLAWFDPDTLGGTHKAHDTPIKFSDE